MIELILIIGIFITIRELINRQRMNKEKLGTIQLLSGLSDDEIKLINNFPDFTVIDWSEESSDINGRCSLTGLFDHCVEIEVRNEL